MMNITLDYMRAEVGGRDEVQLKLVVVADGKRTVLNVHADTFGGVGSWISMPDGRVVTTTEENCAPGGANSFDALVDACGINPSKHLWPILSHLREMDAEVVKHKEHIADMDKARERMKLWSAQRE